MIPERSIKISQQYRVGEELGLDVYTEDGRLHHSVDILIHQSKDHLDKHIIFVFMDRLRDLMLNIRVRLSTREEGYVVQFYEDSPLQPSVLITDDVNGQKVISPFLVHLKETPTIFIERVLHSKI